MGDNVSLAVAHMVILTTGQQLPGKFTGVAVIVTVLRLFEKLIQGM